MTDTEVHHHEGEKHPAEIAKLESETRKLQGEIEVLGLDKLFREQELREQTFKANHAELDTVYRKIEIDHFRRMEEQTLAEDHYAKTYVFDKPFNSSSVKSCLKQLSLWNRIEGDTPQSWTVVINSPGGEINPGLHLFDEIDTYSLRGGGAHEITMLVRGYAASMAGILLQAADVRVMGRRADILVHELSAGTGGGMGQMEDDIKWYRRLCDRIAAIFVARSDGNMTKAYFTKQWRRADWWLDADEALTLGMIDRIG